jgi:hypothetical protein
VPVPLQQRAEQARQAALAFARQLLPLLPRYLPD